MTMDVFQKNELKAHILALATHTARSVLFQDIAHTREVEGKKEQSDKYWRRSQEESEYADRKQAYIWELIDKL